MICILNIAEVMLDVLTDASSGNNATGMRSTCNIYTYFMFLNELGTSDRVNRCFYKQVFSRGSIRVQDGSG